MRVQRLGQQTLVRVGYCSIGGRDFQIMSEDPSDELIVASHRFEVELSMLVTTSHQLTIEAVAKSEKGAIAEAWDELGHEDQEVLDSQVRLIESMHSDMRRAANYLAVVGLVTRLDHWIAEFVCVRLQLRASNLCKNLTILNDSLKNAGPVPFEFFEGLVVARDSVIHADSKAEWKYKGSREVPKQYRNGSELAVSENQVKEAIEQAIAQVKWYDENLPRHSH